MPPKPPPETLRMDVPAGSPEAPAVAIDSAALLQGRSEVVIRHAGREYRLRRTRLDKLILTA